MDKKDLAKLLREIGIALELTDSSPFRARTYLGAARELEHSPYTLEQLVAEQRASELKGWGSSLTERLQEYWQTGALGLHQELRSKVPDGLWEVLDIPGLGSKRVRALYEMLGITSLGELEYACNENRLLELKGFGPKMQENVLTGLAAVKSRRGQLLLSDALALVGPLASALRDHPQVLRVEPAGELRRVCPVVSQLQLIVACRSPQHLLAELPALAPQIAWEIADSDRAVGQTAGGVSYAVSCCPPEEFAWHWWQATGNDAHLQQAAEGVALDWAELRRLPDEQSIYARLGLPFIAAGLREGEQEVAWARSGQLPPPLQLADLTGALHNHSIWSDGAAALSELRAAAAERGWRYLGVADHSQSAVYAGGLTPERVRQQWAEIDQLNATAGVRLLKGIEADIQVDGRLDYDDELLAGFDYVVASVHSQLRLPGEQMTERLLRAVRHPATSVLGHPTNRLLLGRGESQVDLPAVIAEAARLGKALELNANPHRLDLDWRWCRAAKLAGVKIAINPDAHRVSGLDDLQYGVWIANKAGLTREDLLQY